MCMVKTPRCFKDANHIPPWKKPLNYPNLNDMTKIFSKNPICQTIWLRIYKQGSLIRDFRVFSEVRRKPAHISWFPASIHRKSSKFHKKRQVKKTNQLKEIFHDLHVCSQQSVVPWAGNCTMFTVCYQLLQLLLWGLKIKQANVYVNQRFP